MFINMFIKSILDNLVLSLKKQKEYYVNHMKYSKFSYMHLKLLRIVSAFYAKNAQKSRRSLKSPTIMKKLVCVLIKSYLHGSQEFRLEKLKIPACM